MSSRRPLSIPISAALLVLAGLAAVAVYLARKEPAPPAPGTAGAATAWRLTPLGTPPDWSRLDAWQGRLTQEEFRHRLHEIASDGTSADAVVQIRDGAAHIRRSSANASAGEYVLKFRAPAASAAPDAPPAQTTAPGITPGGRYWRTPAEMGPVTDAARPLAGVRISIDPGHIGGYWAQIEERSFSPDAGIPIREGNHSLQTAQLLKPELERLGAVVSMVRTKLEPVTDKRPEDYRSQTVTRREAEKIFYRDSEFNARARRINEELKPDLVLCLHFNADGWGGPGNPVFSPVNHFHMIVHGCATEDEFALDDQRLEILHRMVEGAHLEEIAIARPLARSMMAATGLPAYAYSDRASARQVAPEPVWARNLGMNRRYRCPVVLFEPWVMNNAVTAARLRAGDYEGEMEFSGQKHHSIYREYVDGILAGLREYYTAARARPDGNVTNPD